MNVAQLIIDSIERFGEYPCVYHDGRWHSNRERLLSAEKLASVLRDQGVQPGDRVLVMMANDPTVLDAFHAIWRLGAVIIPVTPQWVAREVRYVLEHSGAKLAITSSPLAPRVVEAAENLSSLQSILVHGPCELASTIHLEPLMAEAQPITTMHDCDQDDLAMLIYTSGTTGFPKGVMQSHKNLLVNVQAAARLLDMPPYVTTMQVLPLSHVFGVLCMNIVAICGQRLVIMPTWDTRKIFETIQNFKVARFSVVPTMLTYLLNFPDRQQYDCSSLEMVSTGGAATPDEVRVEFERTFHCRIKDGYGCSEATCAISSYHDSQPHRVGSVGLPLHEFELIILDDKDQPVPTDTEGEVCVRGPHVMRGYWKDPETTQAAMRSGWLHTGDLGRVDADGYLYITGRKKDLIIKGGENISPREIEDAIYQHPAVAETAVIGIPDETFGEQVCAVVVLRPGQSATETEIQQHVAGFVNKFKVPSKVIFRADLPKSPVGKILKRELRQEYAAAQ
ncbi:MAG: class I adenylate-forming enzyme family protein [Planctomycetota bacterium]